MAALLAIITGPIASGKSSTAEAVGHRLRVAGQSVAVLDFDDLVDTIGGFVDLSTELWRRAFPLYGGTHRLLAQGRPGRRRPRTGLHRRAAGARRARRTSRHRCPQASLRCSYEVALERVTAATTRKLSRDPRRLPLAYDRFKSSIPPSSPPDWTFDTTACSLDDVVDQLSSALIG